MSKAKYKPSDDPDVSINELHFVPNSEPQAAFFASEAYEVLFGGSSGSGKSISVVIDPLRYVGYKDYTATIFRRTFPQLEKSIMPYCRAYYPHAGATYNEQKKTWTFPSGALIRLGTMEHLEDWENYKGDESAGHYYDELTTFHWEQYTGLAPWNRSKVAGIEPYRRATSNPGGLSHIQVKNYFVDTCPLIPNGPKVWSELAQMWWQPVLPGEIFWWEAENKQRLSRQYIPARVFDNEDLLRKNPLYLAQLLAMEPEKRRAYIEGDWDIFEGQFFDAWRNEIHVIDPLTKDFVRSFPNAAKRAGLDYGQRTVLEVQLRDYEGNIINFGECYTEYQTPTERAEAMIPLIEAYELWNLRMVYDTNMDIDLKYTYEHSKKPAEVFRDVFRKHFKNRAPVMSVIAKKSEHATRFRIVCNETMKEYLRWTKDPDGKITMLPKFRVTRNCQHFIRTLPELIHDPDSPDGLDFDDQVGEDDPYDATKMCLIGLRKASRTEQQSPPKTMEEYIEREVEKIRQRAQTKGGKWDKI